MSQSDVQKSRAGQDAARVTAVCRLIEQEIEAGKRVPTLERLAKYAGLSPFHFQRLFRRVTGVTPRDYAAAQREQRLRAGLGSGASVTHAIVHAGYNSSSRFYEKADAVLGMMPSRYRAGGIQEEIRFAVGECTLGSILVARSERGICAILLGDDPDSLLRELQDRFPRASLIGGDDAFEQVVAKVVGFVETPRLGLELPLDIRGTAFQRRVWQVMRKIPAGKTLSYTDIARRIGAPQAVRAVAGACAANALAVAIPCHRVVRNDGALSGYRWGIERKQALLEKESESK
jgi:AraC family transcriptional regulator of adaptative response/methylated-DNA-[protein]-cysteine methyltransferase